jgi:small conductance mechanosensitive channel
MANPLLAAAAPAAAHAPQPPPPPLSDQIADFVARGPAAWLPFLSGAAHLALNLAIGALILVVTFWAASWASRLARQAMSRLHRQGARTDAVLEGFVGSLVKYTVVVVGGIAVLEQIGVQTTSVLAVLGAASLAIGLALQGGLSNVASGVMILMLRPYRIGDRVTIADKTGRIHGLDLFMTRLHDLENSVVFIPNSKVMSDVIVNFSLEKVRRIQMDFNIDFADDIDLALAVLIEVAEADERIVADPAPWAKVTEIGESTVTVSLRAWTAPVGFRDTRFDLIKKGKQALEAAGLTFAYPHQTAVETRPWTAPDRARQARAKRALKAAPPPDEAAAPKATPRSQRGAGSSSDAS